MRRVLLRNPSIVNVEKTYLTSPYTSGVTLSVINTFAFSANDLLLVELPGSEKAEIKKLSAIASDTSLTLASALKFSHNADTVIFELQWDQVEISAESGSGWSIITTSGLQYDKQYTVYEHASGNSTFSYRWRFYNSITGLFSEYSPTFTGAGFEANQVGYMIRQVRKTTRTDGDVHLVEDHEIVRFLNAAQDIILASPLKWWFLRFTDDDITTLANTYSYNLDRMNGGTAGSPNENATLGFIDNIKYHYVSGATDVTYRLAYKDEAEFDNLIADANRTSQEQVTHYTIRPGDSSSKNGYLEVYPTPATASVGTFLVTGYVKPPVLNDDSDRTAVPIPSILENYCISQIERIRGNDTKAEYYEELFYGPAPSKEKYVRLTGITLLEEMNNKRIPRGQPRQLVRFRGQKAVNRLYGDKYINDRDYIHINYW
jgi:hypothetical protein